MLSLDDIISYGHFDAYVRKDGLLTVSYRLLLPATQAVKAVQEQFRPDGNAYAFVEGYLDSNAEVRQWQQRYCVGRTYHTDLLDAWQVYRATDLEKMRGYLHTSTLKHHRRQRVVRAWGRCVEAMPSLSGRRISREAKAALVHELELANMREGSRKRLRSEDILGVCALGPKLRTDRKALRKELGWIDPNELDRRSSSR